MTSSSLPAWAPSSFSYPPPHKPHPWQPLGLLFKTFWPRSRWENWGSERCRNFLPVISTRQRQKGARWYCGFTSIMHWILGGPDSGLATVASFRTALYRMSTPAPASIPKEYSSIQRSVGHVPWGCPKAFLEDWEPRPSQKLSSLAQVWEKFVFDFVFIFFLFFIEV